MRTNPNHCAWCGTEVKRETEPQAKSQPWFCPDCHHTFEHEAGRSLHAMDVRHPHND